MPQQTNDEQLVQQINTLAGKIEKNYATKADLDALGTALKAFEQRMAEMQRLAEKNRDETRIHPVFGNFRVAKEMGEFIADTLHLMVGKRIPADAPAYREKATLNVTTAANGGYSVPTELKDVLLDLVTRGGRARQYHQVFDGLTGPIDLLKGASEASAAFTADDTTALSETDKTFAKLTLNPQQLGAIMRSSSKLVRNSVLSIATIVANEMTRAAGRLEDNTVLIGDGTATYGSSTGYRNNGSITASASVANVAALTLDQLIQMQVDVHEDIDPETSAYYMSRQVAAALKKLKDTTNRYLIELNTPTPNINGVPVVIWKRMANPTASGDTVVLYGDLRTAGKIGIGRDLALAVSEHVDFTKGGLVWRMLYDFQFAIALPGAVCKIKIT